MARGIAPSTILVFILSLFTYSFARNLFDSTTIDVDPVNNLDSFPLYEKIDLNDDDANSILLPEPEPEPAETLIQLEPEPVSATSKPSEPNPEKTVKLTEVPVPKETPSEAKPEKTVKLTEVPKETTSSKAKDPDAAPLTVFTFPPIDPRIIPRRPSPLPASFRAGRHHHRCRHNNHHYKPWKPRLLPRRNDVVLNSAELDKEFDRVVARDWARQVPAEWIRLRRSTEPMLSRERSMDLDRSELWRRVYPRHHRRHRHRREPENKGAGLMKRIRKFLNRF